MLRWYWYLCGSAYAKQTSLLCTHESEDYERWRATLLGSYATGHPLSRATPLERRRTRPQRFGRHD